MPSRDRFRELTGRVTGERRRTLRQSFADAFDGLWIALRERNMRIHFVFMGLVVLVGVLVRLDHLEWAGVLLVVGMVIRDEIKNSAIERLVDLQAPLQEPTQEEIRTRAREAKHLSAASVLWGAITSVLCGLIIIIPKLFA